MENYTIPLFLYDIIAIDHAIREHSKIILKLNIFLINIFVKLLIALVSSRGISGIIYSELVVVA